MFDPNMKDLMATILFASNKATTIKEAVHLAYQISDATDARLRKDRKKAHSPKWVQAAEDALEKANQKATEEE